MKNDKDIENILLNDAQYEKFINQKNEKEFLKALSDVSEQRKEIKDIKLVPKEKLFSKDAVYLVINRQSKSKSYINGVQAEGFIADNNIVREKILSGISDSFIKDNVYIKFYKLA